MLTTVSQSRRSGAAGTDSPHILTGLFSQETQQSDARLICWRINVVRWNVDIEFVHFIV